MSQFWVPLFLQSDFVLLLCAIKFLLWTWLLWLLFLFLHQRYRQAWLGWVWGPKGCNIQNQSLFTSRLYHAVVGSERKHTTHLLIWQLPPSPHPPVQTPHPAPTCIPPGNHTHMHHRSGRLTHSLYCNWLTLYRGAVRTRGTAWQSHSLPCVGWRTQALCNLTHKGESTVVGWRQEVGLGEGRSAQLWVLLQIFRVSGS